MVLLPLNFAKAAGWLFSIQVRHFVTQLLKVFLVSWGSRFQKSKMEINYFFVQLGRPYYPPRICQVYFGWTECCLRLLFGLCFWIVALSLFFLFPACSWRMDRKIGLSGLVWRMALTLIMAVCSKSCCCKQHSAPLPVGLFIFPGEAGFSKKSVTRTTCRTRILSSLNRNVDAGERLKNQVSYSEG